MENLDEAWCLLLSRTDAAMQGFGADSKGSRFWRNQIGPPWDSPRQCYVGTDIEGFSASERAVLAYAELNGYLSELRFVARNIQPGMPVTYIYAFTSTPKGQKAFGAWLVATGVIPALPKERRISLIEEPFRPSFPSVTIDRDRIDAVTLALRHTVLGPKK